MSDGEFSLIVEKLSTETAIRTEKILQQLRDMCQSDEEFSQRCCIRYTENQPKNITQYYFDNNPIFFSMFTTENYTIRVTFHYGSYLEDYAN
jgi:hypothetical protein